MISNWKYHNQSNYQNWGQNIGIFRYYQTCSDIDICLLNALSKGATGAHPSPTGESKQEGSKDAGERKRHSLGGGWGHPRTALVRPVWRVPSVDSSVSKKKTLGQNLVCLKALREDLVLYYLSNNQIKRQLLTPETTKSSFKNRFIVYCMSYVSWICSH